MSAAKNIKGPMEGQITCRRTRMTPKNDCRETLSDDQRRGGDHLTC